MKKNLLYLCLTLLIAVIFFAFAESCKQYSVPSEEEMNIEQEEKDEDIDLEEDKERDIDLADPGDTIITYIDSPGIGEIAVRIAVPEIPRYSEGAPIVFDVSTWFVPLAGFHMKFDATRIGAINILHLWPGKEDPDTGAKSEGTNDFGGTDAIASLRDAILFASGKIPDVNGYYLDELISINPLFDNIGLYASSHSGVVATNVLAYSGKDLETVKYFIGRENPTIPEMYPLEIGHFDERRNPVYNPFYDQSGYTPISIEVDYSTLGWIQNEDYPEGRPYHFVPNGDDYIQDGKGPTIWGKRYFSTPLTQALLDNGVFTLETWPEGVATPQETMDIWPYRTTVYNYEKIKENLSDLKVMLVFASDDHVQSAIDKPHIHQAYDGFHEKAGLWTRLNPDLAYARYMNESFMEKFSDNPANQEPGDWNKSRFWGHPYSNDTIEPMSLAAMAEMADRIQADQWSPDLEEVLFDY